MHQKEEPTEELHKNINRHLKRWIFFGVPIAILTVLVANMLFFQLAVKEIETQIALKHPPELTRSIHDLRTELGRLTQAATDAQARAEDAVEKVDAMAEQLREIGSRTQELRATELGYLDTISNLDQSPAATTILRRLRRLERDHLAMQPWLSTGYCVLANGQCPGGFTRHEGYMKAILLSDTSPAYVEEGGFGDSSIVIAGGDRGHWVGQLNLVFCCRHRQEQLSERTGDFYQTPYQATE